MTDSIGRWYEKYDAYRVVSTSMFFVKLKSRTVPPSVVVFFTSFDSLNLKWLAMNSTNRLLSCLEASRLKSPVTTIGVSSSATGPKWRERNQSFCVVVVPGEIYTDTSSISVLITTTFAAHISPYFAASLNSWLRSSPTTSSKCGVAGAVFGVVVFW
uniref:(northern house mosquito) hypothetical protein n=1 Tax=Culex pipiens TaxID=7175 RepID=A0A8D8A3R9_CULPI